MLGRQGREDEVSPGHGVLPPPVRHSLGPHSDTQVGRIGLPGASARVEAGNPGVRGPAVALSARTHFWSGNTEEEILSPLHMCVVLSPGDSFVVDSVSPDISLLARVGVRAGLANLRVFPPPPQTSHPGQLTAVMHPAVLQLREEETQTKNPSLLIQDPKSERQKISISVALIFIFF